MARPQSGNRKSTKDLVEVLLRHPTKNLTSRIAHIEAQRIERQRISDDIDVGIGSRLLAAKTALVHARYDAEESRNRLREEISRLESDRLAEMRNRFLDVQGLEERLQEAIEDLKTNQLRQSFINRSQNSYRYENGKSR